MKRISLLLVLSIFLLFIHNIPIYAEKIDFKKTFEDKNKEKEIGLNYGKELGLLFGKICGYRDFQDGNNNSYLEAMPLEEEIIRMFNLDQETYEYRNEFMLIFKEKFKEGYEKGFRKSNFQLIKTFQELFYEKFSEAFITKVLPVKGGEISTSNNSVKLKIESGTYYNDVVATIELLSEKNLNLKDYISASNIYNIKLHNESNDYNDEKKLELSFEYYGPQSGGIYKYINGQWLYIPSYIENNRIKTDIAPSLLKEENRYCVLIDKTFVPIYDVRGHWARDEINTYLRRKYIFGYEDKTFRPDNAIKKGEFLAILNRVHNCKLSENYIFDLKQPLTYEEAEIIIKKMTNNKNFSWDDIASKMLYKKGVRSKSYNNKENYITRAETVYMLCLLSEIE